MELLERGIIRADIYGIIRAEKLVLPNISCLEELTLVLGDTGSKANQVDHVRTSFDFTYS